MEPEIIASSEHPIQRIPDILPKERVFPIQVGGELFRLSGASLSSDAPSYFSQYFLCQIHQAIEAGEDNVCNSIRTLNIDRDPVTFRDIVLHLQGYHITPRDGRHYVRLFADAQFYSLPKLISQLFDEDIFISIGHREFQIPRNLLTGPGNSPNYFSLGFSALCADPKELFPGLDRKELVRPPSILPPSIPHRDAGIFADILRLLQGYSVEIRNEAHREHLLRDARYFHFKGVEQQLVPHHISYNPMRQRDEIALLLENVQKSGVSVYQGDPGESQGKHGEDGETESFGKASSTDPAGMVYYTRPYVDDRPAELVLEIGNDATRIHFTGDGPRAEFFKDTRARVAKLLEVIATKLGLPPTKQPLGLLMVTGGAESQPVAPGNTTLSEDLVKVVFEPESTIVLNGKDHIDIPGAEPADHDLIEPSAVENPRKRRRPNGDASDSISSDSRSSWTVKTGQWRLRVQQSTSEKLEFECVFLAVRVDAITSERGRNQQRTFLRR